MTARWVRKSAAGLIVVLPLLVTACDDNPVDEGRGDAVDLTLNPGFVVVDAADTSRINSNARDRYFDPTLDGVTFGACDAKITVEPDPTLVDIEPPDRVIVIGEMLGATCVTIAGPGGGNDTATVEVVPASLIVTAAPDTLRAGQTGEVVVETLDKAGATVGPFARTDATYASSAPTIVEPSDDMGSITTSQAGNGDITATWSGAGLTRSISATVVVIPNVPASSELEADSFPVLGPADNAEMEVLVLDAEGNQNTDETEILGVTANSSDEGVATVSAELVTGNSVNVILTVTGVATGSADITGTVQTSEGDLDFGTANSTVVNPVISGISPDNGPVGTEITLSGSALQVTGLDTEVTVGGEPADNFVSSTSSTEIVLNVPAAGGGDNDVVVTVGGVASDPMTFNQTSSNTDAGEPNDDVDSATPISLPLDAFFTTDDVDLDDFYEMTFAAQTTVLVDLDWNTGADLDILFTDTAGDFISCFDGATGDQPEQAECTFDAGTFYLWINNFSEDPLTTYHVTVVEQ